MHAPGAASAWNGRTASPLHTCTAAVALGVELRVVYFNQNFAPAIVGVGDLVLIDAAGSPVTSERAACIGNLFQIEAKVS
jgi:hypothetical protein